MWARRRLRMILHRENRVLAVPHAFHGVVIEVEVRHDERLGAGHARRIPFDREAVILRRDKYLPCLKIAHWMVAAAMAVRQFRRPSAERQAEQLVTEANPEDRERAVAQLPNRLDGVAHGGGIARSGGEEQAVGLELAN